MVNSIPLIASYSYKCNYEATILSGAYRPRPILLPYKFCVQILVQFGARPFGRLKLLTVFFSFTGSRNVICEHKIMGTNE